MKEIKEILIRYRGAIIGGLVALLILFIKLHLVILWIIILAFGIYVGNYIQINKEKVKSKIKTFVDKL